MKYKWRYYVASEAKLYVIVILQTVSQYSQEYLLK